MIASIIVLIRSTNNTGDDLMRTGSTNRGLAWEIINSWWILFSFFALSWVSFMIIAYLGKKMKWLMIAVALLFVQYAMFIVDVIFEFQGTLDAFVMWSWFAAYAVGIILCFASRKEYLVRRDILLDPNRDEDNNDPYRHKIRAELISQGCIKVD